MARTALVAWHKELAPAGETSVVFRDSAFADDVAKTESDRYSPAARSRQCEELVNMAPKNPERVQQPRPLEGGLIRVGHGSLMDRVVSILEQARANVAHAVNSNMVIAYWLIGREIVEALQSGADRAEYGQSLLNDLSEQLGKRYGQGFSVTNLRHFRLFYQAFSDRKPAIHHSASDELATLAEDAVLVDMKTALETTDKLKGFSPNLSWTHYRTLCKVEHRAERRFYEIEAEKAGWSVSVLERQIHSLLFARLLKRSDKAGVLALAEQGQTVSQPIDVIKHPYVLDFLGLPDQARLRESDLETAIIENLQPFLLELGKGFAFVARQYRVATESQHFFIDLVFYNYLLKCFVLIDMKKLGPQLGTDVSKTSALEIKQGPSVAQGIGIGL